MDQRLLGVVVTFWLAAGLAAGAQTGGVGSGDIPRAPQEIRPLLIGAKIPAVSVRNAEGADVALPDVFRKEPTILIVYRGGW